MGAGNIGTVISTLEFNTSCCIHPAIIHAGGDVYAVAYKGDSNDGFITTMPINSSGIIGAAIQTLEFDPIFGDFPDMIHISGEVYAIVYHGDSKDGIVKTISINAAGQISTIDTWIYGTNYGGYPQILHVSGNIYAIACQETVSYDGFIKTVTISDAGVITKAIIATYEFATDHAASINFLHVSGNVFVLAYSSTSNAGIIRTVTISDAGAINGIATRTYESGSALDPSFTRVAGNIFATVYRTITTYAGHLKTMTVSDAGAISAVIDTLQLAAAEFKEPHIISVTPSIVGISFNGAGGDGFIETVSIDGGGTIGAIIDTLEFDTVYCDCPVTINVSGNIWAVAYTGNSDDGFIKTFGIDSGGGGGATIVTFVELLGI